MSFCTILCINASSGFIPVSLNDLNIKNINAHGVLSILYVRQVTPNESVAIFLRFSHTEVKDTEKLERAIRAEGNSQM